MPRKTSEYDEDFVAAMDAALDEAEKILQKHAKGTVWAGSYDAAELSLRFERHIRTHMAEEMTAIAEYGDFQHWLDAGKPDPWHDKRKRGAHRKQGKKRKAQAKPEQERGVCECGRWEDECTFGKDGSKMHGGL